MLKKRVIPILQLKDDELVKSMKFQKHKYVGDPINAVRIFNEIKVDEIIILDVFKSKTNNDLNYELIKDIADECRMPFTYGGGIKNIKQVEKLFELGVEKISINNSFLKDYKLINDLSKIFGSQSIITSIDINRDIFGKNFIYSWINKENLKININDHINNCINNGAGEILINVVQNEGTLNGFDFSILDIIAKSFEVPVIVNGGINSYEEIRKILTIDKVDAVGIGAFFIYYGPHKAVLISYIPENERI
mgnify:CR=1 FL=1